MEKIDRCKFGIGYAHSGSGNDSAAADIVDCQKQKNRCVKLIHGYGSTGKGGAIRSAVRRELNLRAEAGEIRCYICGEDFSPFDESSRWAIARYPYLCRDQDYARINHGITIVVL